MTKEELEKEAKQSYFNTTTETQWSEEGAFEYTRGYQDGAEPREKHIAELEKENEMFKKANEIIAQQRDGRDADISILENRIEDLKSQIKKMKCCGNCYRIENCEADGVCDNWKIKEIKEK